MRVRTTVSVLLSIALIAGPAGAGGLRLAQHAPKDPVLVWVMTVDDLAQTYDGILQFVERLGEGAEADSINDGLAKFEAKIGCSVRDDLLTQIGPEFGLILDLPPVDEIAAQFGANPLAAVPVAFGKLGLMATVRDAGKLDDCLRKFFLSGEARITEENGLVRAVFGEPEAASGISVYYGFKDGAMALGASMEFVNKSLEPRARGERLADGADFARVFSHLDKEPLMLTYINVPKVRTLIEESQMLKGLIDATPQVRQIVDMFLTPEMTGMGIGATSIEIDGGTRQTSFGPSGLTGGAMYAGIIAAIAVPNLLNAIDRGKQKRSMADIRSAAVACESFAIDYDRYPGPTDGFVPIGEIAESVEPVYIRALARNDGWGNPILYWSDGESYRIVSHGKDGVASQDWSGEFAGGPTTTFTSDIVFLDGAFAVWPEGTQE